MTEWRGGLRIQTLNLDHTDEERVIERHIEALQIARAAKFCYTCKLQAAPTKQYSSTTYTRLWMLVTTPCVVLIVIRADSLPFHAA